jgi:hypothetical protein
MPKNKLIYLIWSAFSISLYLIGLLGVKYINFSLPNKNNPMLPSRAIRKISFLIIGGFFMAGNLGAQKLLDAVVTYYYPSDRDSVNGVKISYEYDDNSKQTTHSIYFWDQSANRWAGGAFPVEECAVCVGRFEYGFDERGNQVSTGGFVWSGYLTGWALRTLTENGFDDSGNQVRSSYSIWNTSKNRWEHSLGWEYGFDDKDRMTSGIVKFWDPEKNAWRPFDKTLYDYDSIGRKMLELRQTWIDSISNWANLTKKEWYFDTVGIQTEIVSYTWALSNNSYSWKENDRHKIENVFDAAGHRILTTDYLKSSTRWTATYQEEISYNESGKPVLSVISKGNPALTESLRSEWEYDENNRLTKEIQTGVLQRREGLEIQHKRKVIRSFDSDGDIAREIWFYWDGVTKTYLPDSKDYFVYHSIVASTQEARPEPIRLYPNPTNGVLQISGLLQPANIMIYTMQGMVVRSIHQVDHSIDISDLPSGTYLILITEAGNLPFRTLFVKE